MTDLSISTPKTVDLSLMLRGIFASFVVFWHTVGAYHTETIPGWLNVSGRASVWIFFGLSGYVIGYGFFSGRYGWQFRRLASYFGRRAARILPLFWLVNICAVGLTLAVGPSAVITPRTLAMSFFAAQWSHTTYFVGVFWTLGVEIQFYLVAPLVAYVMAKSGTFGPLLACAAWVGLWATFSGDDRTVVGNLQHFLIGMIVAKLYLSGSLDRLLGKRIGILLFALLGVAALFISNALYQDGSFWSGAGALWTDLAILFLLLSHCASERLVLAANQFGTALMVIGVLAYGLYAWHGLLLTFVPSLDGSFVAVYLLSITLAWASYKLIESPAVLVSKRS